MYEKQRYCNYFAWKISYSIDGCLDCVIPNKISVFAWKNHLEKRDKSGNLKERKDTDEITPKPLGGN